MSPEGGFLWMGSQKHRKKRVHEACKVLEIRGEKGQSKQVKFSREKEERKSGLGRRGGKKE